MKNVMRKKLMTGTSMIAFALCFVACGNYGRYDVSNYGNITSEESNQEYDEDGFSEFRSDDHNDYVISEESNQEYNEGEIPGVKYDDNDDHMSYNTNESDWEWTENPDETITILGYLGSDENVVIPSILNGKPVTVISDYAFKGNIDIFSVTIPESVISLEVPNGTYAYNLDRRYGTFQNCINLKEVTFLGELILNGDTFRNTPYMEGITSESGDSDFVIINDNLVGTSNIFISGDVIIPDGVKKISRDAFSECGSISSIVIPDSVNYIGEYAFLRCTDLGYINIPDGVTMLKEGCFIDCYSLRHLDLPDSIEAVHPNAFAGSSGLTISYKGNEFTDVANNSTAELQEYLRFGDNDFIIEDGCLILVRGGIDYIELPDDIISISNIAFDYCDKDMIIVYKGKRYTPLDIAKLKEDIEK